MKMNPYIIPGLAKREAQGKPLTVGDDYSTFCIEKIKKACIEETGITKEQFELKTRSRNIVLARQIFTFIVRNKLKYSWHLIALISNQDHSTHIYAYKTIKDLIEVDSKYRDLVSRVENRLLF